MQLLQAYNMLARQNQLPMMQAGDYQLDSEQICDADALRRALEAASPVQGWVQYPSWQGAFEGSWPTPQDGWAPPLAAEWVDAAGDSFTLGRTAEGWRLTRCHHLTTGERLSDQVTLLQHDPRHGRLCYRRYWDNDPEFGIIQRSAWFIGFDKEGA